MILHVEDAKLSMLVIFSWLCLHTCSHALESIFDHSTTLCSPMHKFCLKFAPLQIDPTHRWIANRNDPIDNSSGVLLTCNHSGALSITSQDVVVTLLDSRNFILGEYDASGYMKKVMCQSFDHPSDVFYLWEPRKGELVIRRGGIIFGQVGFCETTDNVPRHIQLMYEYNIVSNKDEESFSYVSHNDHSQRVLFSNGNLQDTENGDLAQAQNWCFTHLIEIEF
ncbi:uncharacterized protein [Phaseolus vulgaris]|uniref:uncharacterized protein n=1 Tax=Phaseolus vulgaris TaxID=3885 RepID=UPI0035C95FFA